LSIERATNVDPSTAVRSKSVVKVQGDKLIVAAPQQFQKPTKSIAPKVVKEKIAQAPVEKGWEPVSDPKAQAELKEKMRKEDPKSVPPPSVQAATSATAATSASAAPATAAASLGATATSPPASNPAPSLDKSRNKKRENAAPKATIAPSTETTAPTVPPKETPTKQKRERPPAAVPEAARVAPPPAPDVEYNRPAQDAAKPDARVEKPKHDRGAEMLKKGPPHEPATSPSP
jgi:hypothetical protein